MGAAAAANNGVLASFGAFGFGALIGWYVYYINRYRKGDVQWSDLTTVVGVIGGGVVTAQFGPGSGSLFGAYGIGLAAGFFGYFAVLVALVARSPNFDWDWFLDGRRRDLAPGISIPDGTRQTQMAFDERPPPSFRPPGQPAMQADAWAAAPTSPVVTACEREFPSHSGDCSAFVRAVAGDLGVSLSGNADAITAALEGPGWTPVPDGPRARTMAEAGFLVVAGLRGADQAKPSAHGHVVVVVPGALAHDRYPTAYWGMLGGTGRKNTTLNWAWSVADRDKLTYAAHPL